MEAFSDGVIAVIITIMVLELKVPDKPGMAGLKSIGVTLGVYLLSFAFTGIYWINHHHLIDRLKRVDHAILWANLAFLFCLSLLPFFTNYMVVMHQDSFSVGIYAASLLLTAIAFTVLQWTVSWQMHHAETDPDELALQAAEARKGRISLALYLLAIGLAQVRPWLTLLCAALVTVMWIVPTFGLERPQPRG
jgi:uncharacterized membrane protein